MSSTTTGVGLEGDRYHEEATGWVGWIWFAGVMMMIGGGLQATHGLIAAINDEWVVWGNSANLYLDLSTWGWVNMIVGTIVFLAGLGVLSGNLLARIIGVVVASLSLVSNFLFLPAYPIWATIVIILDVIVIFALTVHGREAREV
jgi:hypothetical protein